MELKEMCEHYYPLVYGYLVSVSGGDRDAAEELTQETFLQAFRSIKRFRGESSVSTWLCGIAKHLYFKHLRRAAGSREVPLEEAIAAAPGENPEAKLIRKEQMERIRNCIDRMDEPMAQVARFRLYGELSYSQIAELTGHTENWARVMYFRARKKIGEELKADEA